MPGYVQKQKPWGMGAPVIPTSPETAAGIMDRRRGGYPDTSMEALEMIRTGAGGSINDIREPDPEDYPPPPVDPRLNVPARPAQVPSMPGIDGGDPAFPQPTPSPVRKRPLY